VLSNTGGRMEVRMFSGAGIVSVWKSGVDFDGSSTLVLVGFTLLVKLLVTVMNLVLMPTFSTLNE
jgi:hypothetical protein